MTYTRSKVSLFLGLLFALAVLTTSLEDSTRDVQESAELSKAHVVKHYFGRNHHRCRKYGVSCKPPQGQDASEEVQNKQGQDASEEVQNKQGVDAEEKAVEDKKIHTVKHYFGRNHHRCRKYGVSCKDHTSAQGKEDNEVTEKVGNEGVVDTKDQKGVSNGGNN